MQHRKTIQTLTALACAAVFGSASADIVTLNSLTDSVMVDDQDTNKLVAPTPPAAWYTGTYAGLFRGATAANSGRTQWNFRFDISAMAGIAADDITAVTLKLPQIGRFTGTNSYTSDNMELSIAVNSYDWQSDGLGFGYAVWNGGRGQNGGTGTILGDFGYYNDFGQAIDTSNTNVEGTINITSDTFADLLTAVQGWATDANSNEGFLVYYPSPNAAGLAFGTPTLEITYVPEPSSLALLGLGGMLIGGFRATPVLICANHCA